MNGAIYGEEWKDESLSGHTIDYIFLVQSRLQSYEFCRGMCLLLRIQLTNRP